MRLLYRGAVYVKAETDEQHRKAKIPKALKYIPAKYRKGLKVKVEKNTADESGGYIGKHSPGSNEISISYDELMDRYEMLPRAEGAPRPKFPGTYEIGWNDFFKIQDLGLKRGAEYSIIYIAHLLAHEIGHVVWDKVPAEERMKLYKAMEKIKVKSAILAKYRGWIADRQQEWQQSHGRAPAALDSRYGREQFAEMFRQFVMHGSFKPFFSKVDKILAKPPKAAA